MRARLRRASRLLAGGLAAVVGGAVSGTAGGAQDLVVGAGARFATLGAAVAAASPGATIRVTPGRYAEPTVVVRVNRLTIIGEDWPRFDGEGAHEILVIRADSVTVRGLEFANTGISQMEDRSALRVTESVGCVLADNRFRDALFAIYLERSTGCLVRGNDIRGTGGVETRNGNGVHLWYSPYNRVEDNQVRGQRDGIYFEFSRGAVASGNLSEGNRRYGLHFMFSDSCRYERNTFRDNGAGVAVMYSKVITMEENAFLGADGSTGYGLLLKDITDGSISRNRFEENSTGLFLEGASRLDIRDNDFRRNGWAVRLMADAEDSRFRGNLFAGNAFDVSTNSRTLRSDFEGNWWDAYRGYDLDRDGTGDVPFRPVRLFALVVEKHPEALLLLRSPITSVLDAAERVFPVLTPALADPRPLMRAPR
ncbi:MAG: nitrous oxide reductase family maturation protein NosD [Gemmatimonadetes bacterium]|nr:nitrous oxide reductase family maturation protein NosD [Gemmatimonadota bacterium]